MEGTRVNAEQAAPRVRGRRAGAGIALMIVASLAVPVVDGLAKILGAAHSPFFVAWARYATAAVIVLALGLVRSGGIGLVSTDFRSNTLRTVLTVGAMTCFFFAITEIPLATAFGGYFLGPVVAAVLAAPLLGERLTAARLAAGVIGLAGALLIVRPGGDVRAGALLAVLSGLLFAGYLVTTRAAATTTSPVEALRFQCSFGALLLTPLALLNWSWPSGRELLLIAAMGAVSALCHFLVIAAFRFAEAAVLAPLSYFELVTATIFGLAVFSELPESLAWAGIGLIIVSGMLIWMSERAGAPRRRR